MHRARIGKAFTGDCHRSLSTVAAVACVVAIVGCGSSKEPSTGSSKALEVANCMRSHGVPNFPDPSAGGGGGGLPPGIDPQSPAFKSAQHACAKLAPGGTPGGPPATESEFVVALRFARCMRAHGFPGFPDPSHSDSGPPPVLVIGPGLYFRVSAEFNPNTPEVNRSVAACGGTH